MNRWPSLLRSAPPSPRTPSVTSRPRTDSGQTIPVGWNWTDSISITSAPAQMAMAWPSPVDSQRVRGVQPALADRPGRQHDGLGGERDELAGRPPVADGPGDAAVGVGQQAEDLALHEDVDAHGHDLLLERPDDLQAGPVADVGQAGVAVAAEVPLGHPAVLRPVEQRAPALQLVDPLRRLLGVQLGHPPVVQHLAAADRVAEVDLPVVLRVHVAHRRRDATLGHHRVGLAEQRLADQRHPQPRAWASTAARSPAPPAPITITSYWWDSYSAICSPVPLVLAAWRPDRLRPSGPRSGSPGRGTPHWRPAGRTGR